MSSRKKKNITDDDYSLSLEPKDIRGYLYMEYPGYRLCIDDVVLHSREVIKTPPNNQTTEVHLFFYIENIPSTQFRKLQNLYFVSLLSPVEFLFDGCDFAGYIVDLMELPYEEIVMAVSVDLQRSK
jgi:hypothetical protein